MCFFSPHDILQSLFKYLWYGGGSVPWMGPGKYPLWAPILSLLSGVITFDVTRQLGILHKRYWLVITQQLDILCRKYSSWDSALTTKYVSTCHPDANRSDAERGLPGAREGCAEGSSWNEIEVSSTPAGLSRAHAHEKRAGTVGSRVLIPGKMCPAARQVRIPVRCHMSGALLVPRLEMLSRLTQWKIPVRVM